MHVAFLSALDMITIYRHQHRNILSISIVGMIFFVSISMNFLFYSEKWNNYHNISLILFSMVVILERKLSLVKTIFIFGFGVCKFMCWDFLTVSSFIDIIKLVNVLVPLIWARLPQSICSSKTFSEIAKHRTYIYSIHIRHAY